MGQLQSHNRTIVIDGLSTLSFAKQEAVSIDRGGLFALTHTLRKTVSTSHPLLISIEKANQQT
jgi:hypothetical protein